MTYEVMIAAHGMAGNAAAAEASFRSLTRAGFRPRDFAYCGLIAAHSIAGDLPAALNVRARMLQDRVALTVHVYNALMAACERSLQFDRALELFGIMQRDGVEPNAVTKQVRHVPGHGRLRCLLFMCGSCMPKTSRDVCSVTGTQIFPLCVCCMVGAQRQMLQHTATVRRTNTMCNIVLAACTALTPA